MPAKPKPPARPPRSKRSLTNRASAKRGGLCFAHMDNFQMQTVQLQHYIRRSTDFLEGMKLTRTDEPYWNSSALLAIHSAVSYSDALRIGLGDQRLSADDHNQAADALQKLLPSNRLSNQTGLGHFRYLLSKKHLVTYGDRRLERTDYEALFTKAERFAQWVDSVGIQLRIEGWQHDDQ